MKKFKLIIWIPLGVLLCILITILSYYIFHVYIDEEMTFNITGDVIVINDLMSRMYLVKSDSGYLGVDSGLNESIMRKGLENFGINPEEVKIILLTHSDFDHVGGLEIFSNADIYLSAPEAQMIRSNNRKNRFIPFIHAALNPDSCILLDDNEIIQADGRKIECILLPGHTPGSMGYLVDNKYLFTGDAFRIKNGKLTVPDKKIILTDLEDMKKSLRKIAAYKNIEYIFSSHSGFTADFDFAVSEWRGNSEGILK